MSTTGQLVRFSVGPQQIGYRADEHPSDERSQVWNRYSRGRCEEEKVSLRGESKGFAVTLDEVFILEDGECRE